MGAAQHAGILLPAIKFSALVLLANSALTAAPPDVTSLYPAGGAPGEQAAVTATGTFANWPVQVWTSDNRLQVECEKEKGKLKIRIADDAIAGIAWLRLVDDEGASTPRPFVIAHLPSLLEKEPNDKLTQAQQAALPFVAHGRYDKSGDSDAYAVQLTAGQTVVASLQSHLILGSPADGTLQICNEAGLVLAMNQDAGGLDALLSYTAKSDGTYFIRTFALPATPNSGINFAGGELFIYRLTITTGPFADAALPLAIPRGEPTPLKLVGWNVSAEPVVATEPEHLQTEPWYWSPPGTAGLIPLKRVSMPSIVASAQSLTAEGQAIEAPCCVSGVIAQKREVHRFKFSGKKGTKLTIAAESQSLSFDLDPFLKLSTASGQPVIEADDAGKLRDPTLNATLAADGDYVLEVRDLHRSGGPRHVYRLTIDVPQPKLTLSVTAGNQLLEAGKTLEIPVSINRQGFTSEVSIAAVDLPMGVTVEAVTSPAKGETAKQVKLIFTAAADAQAGPIRIVARDAEDKELATALVTQTLGGSTFQHSSIWLAIKKPK
ncbi:hypothetical protein ETAA8_34880 [Anatilimnocola aggregata]|uniref:Peptidase C-terminal archaeal/bacterial domain-containing protein n=1 Tax=Anatilimnocola aggregata TaxID=2528021 RepID=A0A517YDT7_9BACT|nr:PPC domain-containing protein [Anatilimnocola aggregata]QDU28388.1 hypothetical protein ETAA8_34880 [Anatilimnocola aggregata]